MSERYQVAVGAKRQFTIPSGLYKRLALKEGDHLQITLQDDTILLEPMVSVPRRLVSPALLEEMNSRRGPKETDLTLAEFQARRRMQNASSESPVSEPPTLQPLSNKAKIEYAEETERWMTSE